MGIATALIGLTPTYAQIGIWAPILLVVLRFIQGFGVGGEWGGAVLLAVEHSGGERRGLPRLVAADGRARRTPALDRHVRAALVAASRARVSRLGMARPVSLSVLLVGVGLFVRLRVLESPAFAAAEGDAARVARAAARRVSRASARGADRDGDAVRAERHLLHLHRVRAELRREDAGLSAERHAARRHDRVGHRARSRSRSGRIVSDRIGRRPVYLVGRASSRCSSRFRSSG